MPPKHRAFSDRPPKYPPETPYRAGWSRRYDIYTQSVVWHLWVPIDPTNLLEYKLHVSRWALFNGGRMCAATELKKARSSLRLGLWRRKYWKGVVNPNQ